MLQVSVIIPNYNYEKYIIARLESIVNQTFKNFEILFLDDCSTDNSVSLSESILKRAKMPYRILLNDKNSGNPYVQWNKGISEAQGKYIWIAESDDFCEHTFLEKMVPLLDRYKNVGLAYCQTSPIDHNGKPIQSVNYIRYTDILDKAKWTSDYVNNGRNEVENYLCRLCTIINVSSVLFRKEILNHVRGADQRFKQAGDWLTYIKMLKYSDIAYTSTILNYHRLHPGKSTSNTVTNLIYFKDMLEVFQYTHDHFKISNKNKKLQFKHIIGQWNDHYNGPYGRIPRPNNLKLMHLLLGFYPEHAFRIFMQYIKTFV
jgi:glycosyltransferase involved in cell wall biosynthesis